MKVIKDGGAFVIPFLHEVVWISLESLRLEVERKERDALITKDKLRADVKAEFFVKVQPVDEAIQAAARSFGNKMTDTRYVAALVEDKLISALRTVAAQKTLEELNSDRDVFVAEVKKIVEPDLEHNGLSLEGVTVSRLDQTDPRNLNSNNVFDAEGLKTIERIVQEQETQRNLLKNDGERLRKQQDVSNAKQILAYDQDKAEVTAQQAIAVATAQAEQRRISEQKGIEATQAIAVTSLEKDKIVSVAAQAQQEAIAVAEGKKQQAATFAQQLVEVAGREKESAIAKAEGDRAAAQAALALAEAERETARQRVKTVEVVAVAERDKQQTVIAAQAAAEQTYVTSQRTADAEAYKVERKAEADRKAADASAQAKITAANADATAIKARAEAEKDAAIAKAAGQQAEALVPVEVKRQEVQVRGKDVEVLKTELEAREKHGASAQQFELSKLQIQMEAQVRIAAANSLGQMVGSIKAQVFGTPEDVSQMVAGFGRGVGLGNTIEGLLKTLPPQIGERVAEVVDAVTEKLAPESKRKPEASKPEASKPEAK